MKRILIPTFLILALYVCAGRAWAQTPLSPSVFAGAPRRETDESGLLALVEVFESYDDNVLAAERGGPTGPRSDAFKVGGLYSGLDVAAQYRAGDDEGGAFTTWVNTAVRHYPDLNLTPVYHMAAASLVQPLTRRISLQVSPSVAYYPLYSMGFLQDRDSGAEPIVSMPLTTAAPDLDPIFRGRSIRYGGSAGLSVAFSSASNLSFRYGYAKTDFDGRLLDAEVQTGGVTFVHRLSRNASFKLGYLRRAADRRFGYEPQLIQNVNIGVDYRRPLSRSRRSYVRFSTGSAIVEELNRRRVVATGMAGIVHQMGRTWTAQMDYHRTVGYVDGFVRPVLTDSATAEVDGLVTRRLDFAFYARYYKGTSGLGSDSERFENSSATARLRTALSKTLAAYVECRVYRHAFGTTAVTPLNVQRAFRRLGVRVGLSYYLPLVE